MSHSAFWRSSRSTRRSAKAASSPLIIVTSRPAPIDEFVTDVTGSGARDEVDVEIDEFELIFSYPWPGEEELYFDIFEQYASEGSYLLTYHGACEGIQLHRL